MKKFMSTAGTEGFELKYYKTTTQGEDGGTNFFGVFVEKYVDGNLVEEMESGPVCEDDAQIADIIGRLAQGGVTPLALCEVLDEMQILA